MVYKAAQITTVVGISLINHG